MSPATAGEPRSPRGRVQALFTGQAFHGRDPARGCAVPAVLLHRVPQHGQHVLRGGGEGGREDQDEVSI